MKIELVNMENVSEIAGLATQKLDSYASELMALQYLKGFNRAECYEAAKRLRRVADDAERYADEMGE